jgi:hypothetical protein
VVASTVVPVGLLVAVCAFVVVAALPDSPSKPAAGPAPTFATFAPGQPRIGVSGAEVDRSERLARELGANGKVLGRTFEIADSLDRWAQRAAIDGGGSMDHPRFSETPSHP